MSRQSANNPNPLDILANLEMRIEHGEAGIIDVMHNLECRAPGAPIYEEVTIRLIRRGNSINKDG